MTTIVYRNGIMAADSRAYSGQKVPIGYKQKIRRLEDGTLIGASSTVVGGAGWALDWYEQGCPAEPGKEVNLPDSFNLLIAKPTGEVFIAKDIGTLTGPLYGDYFAIGSGEEFALGAMAYSQLCNAIAAVAASCKLDVWSDLPIFVASHSGAMPKLIVDISPEMIKWVE